MSKKLKVFYKNLLIILSNNIGHCMKSRKDYNYKQYTFLLDLDNPDEKAISEWLDKNKKKNNGYCAQIRKALKKLMEEDSKK